MAEMSIPMNDFARQWQDTGAPVLEAVRAVGESGWYVLGQQVAGFESALGEHIGRRHVIGCANGLDAIEIGLRALGLKPGQKVLTTPLSAFATSLAIVRAGGVPVFVDVDDSGLVDLALAAGCLARDPSIRFFVPVHLYGHALDLERLSALAERFELAVVEDCCQAIGAGCRGRPVGSVGRTGALSFYPTKNLGALGDAGAVITDDPSVAETCRSLRDYGQTAKYVHDLSGMNSRLDELHAAILLRAFLPKLADWTARRRALADAYLSGIRHPEVRPFPVPDGSDSVWHLFPVRLPAAQRDAFMAHLRSQGVHSAIHYPKLIHEQQALAHVPFVVHGALGRAEAIAREQVSLPIHPYLDAAEAQRVVDAVNAYRAP